MLIYFFRKMVLFVKGTKIVDFFGGSFSEATQSIAERALRKKDILR
jgi:hypothetical protein